MSSSPKNTTPVGGFLSLAPAVSDSYPKQQAAKPATATATVTAAATATSSTDSAASTAPIHRRTSSVSSTGSASQYKGLRFLKLGPVHFGEHPGEHKADFHEHVVDE